MNEKKTATEMSIGPGTYVGHQTYKNTSSYVPFHSTTTREDDGPIISEAPPPGHYDPKYPGSGNYDGGLPKKYVPFKSTEQRFSSDQVSSKKQTPGPGQYTLKGSVKAVEKGEHRTMGVANSGGKASLRALSAPSIPARTQSYGYEEGKGGKLVRNKGPKQTFAGEHLDCVGPAEYYVDVGFTKKRVTGGHIPTTPRESRKFANSNFPGPGHYLEKRVSRSKRPGASFVSKVARIQEANDDKDILPGPGQYNVSHVPREIEPRLNHQFFGSTVERFTAKRKMSRCPGPGSYAIEGAIGQNAANLKTTTERWRKPKKHTFDDPGPGQYEVTQGFGIDCENIMNCTKSFSVLGNQGALAFGAMSTRFIKSAGQERPGPGAYSQEKTDDVTRMTQTQPSSFFRSKVAKDSTQAQIKITEDHGPPPGVYDPRPWQETAEVVRIPQKKEGFLTGASRFKSHDGEFEVGPGQYNPSLLSKQAFNRNMGFHRGGVPIGFTTCANRFNGASTKRSRKDIPGPGDYNIDSPWVKRSYNCLFGEVL